MKRERETDHNTNSITMAKYLMLLSGGSDKIFDQVNYSSNFNNRVFECKTCKRQFSSFQALGGHRASHKKPRLMEMTSDGDDHHGSILTSTTKAKTHACSICGLEFGIGQALGGHMRRHRRTESSKANNSNGNMHNFMTTTTTSSSNSGCSTIDNSTNTDSAKRSKGNSKRFLFLDLNFTPLENDLKFLKVGQPTPNLVDRFNSIH
ncbi:putative transcription factor C2H2 family [Medicago truncatula]|uniref:C2H2-type zinc finger protein n=1 Tax=Medicago truncatula TaxID=3880 RepID=A0A072VS27_MEDTR|nr:zinc finger protein ZAT11 [Medicago truncatula]KEH44476.1 C2H2-type zinc finger protein [Medicago truncatula]RHN82696.1 putative transcription factor C2H2 family [Medicago truncatula]